MADVALARAPYPFLTPSTPPTASSPATELEICRRPDGSLWLLGAGGFGRVYKALRFGCTPVAVKVLQTSCHANSRELESFRLEARLLSNLQHPHIVSLLAACMGARCELALCAVGHCGGCR